MHNTYPDWSGVPVLTSEGDQLTISVAYSDPRPIRPPDGDWSLTDIIQDAEEESETYVYRRD